MEKYEKLIKVDLNFTEPLIDEKINGKSWLVKMTVGDYLRMSSTESNKYQRNLQNLSFYNKLIKDLLDDTVMPPISVVYPQKDIDFEKGLDPQKKFIILDGLQRTNSILECLEIIEKGNSNGKFKDITDFKEKKIYVEIWEKLDLKYILYKMVVLNTGQKKMDYEHQLDILSESVEEILKANNINYITKKQEVDQGKSENFKLSTITTGLVSFIIGKPSPGKKNAAEFLFERFNISIDGKEDENVLSVINDDTTYRYISWVLKDFDELLTEKYGKDNPLRKYEVFLISLFGSLGAAYTKNPERLERKIELLTEMFKIEKDPLRLEVFNSIYTSFKTGIGQKRRRFIYETFKLFLTLESSDRLEWEEIYDDIN
ncbi:hypothetical protein PDL10_16885 [Bacillus cereus]|nr:hypothetical protein [Bacillus cereus]